MSAAALDNQVWAAISPVLAKADGTAGTAVQLNRRAGPAVAPEIPADVTDVATKLPKDEDRPTFLVFHERLEAHGGKLRPGVWHFGIKPGKDDAPPILTQQWICSPLHVTAVTFDGQSNNFGRLLVFRNTVGQWRRWAMPMELLRGAGDDLRGELLAMGLELDPQTRNLLMQYLQHQPPERHVRCALQVGWCDKSFVLPDTVIGPDASTIIFQSGERGHAEYTIAGTLAEWQSEIAAHAAGNPLLMLALSAAFAGPLLSRCNAEGGGLHFYGNSATGKSTMADAACSVWGGANYRRSWRATANGLEGAAALFNDNLLVLDEISECDPKEIGAVVYMLGNGQGKQRASRTGSARSINRWKCFVVSNGERTIGTAMSEGGQQIKAGQSVRLLDIPVMRQFGAWDDLQGEANGATLSDSIKRAAIENNGHAGREFLSKLTHDNSDFSAALEPVKRLPEFAVAATEDGQVKRAAARFALIALAGALATEYGVTGWPEGAAIEAAAIGFKLWKSQRSSGNAERVQIIEQLSAFIDRHGDGRFSAADDGTVVRDRAGWWRGNENGREYLFTADGMKDATKGFELKRALDALVEAGIVAAPGADGERAKRMRIGGRLVRVYVICADKLGVSHGIA